jgi:hypothetical protein
MKSKNIVVANQTKVATDLFSSHSKTSTDNSVHERIISSSSTSIGALLSFHTVTATVLILLSSIESTHSFTLMMGKFRPGLSFGLPNIF